MIAMLGMYDMPEIQGANDRYWSAIRARLGFGPETLTRDRNMWDIWQSLDLVLAQTCGMPFRTRLHDKVTRVGTPDYDLLGCPPGFYQSVLVVRADESATDYREFDGTRFAFNDRLSQSGWAAPLNQMQDFRFSELVETGGHRNSVSAIARKEADIAGIDAVTWDLLCEHEPMASELKVVARTKPTPGLPYITARDRDPEPIATAIAQAIEDLDADDRKALRLRGIVQIDTVTYLTVPSPSLQDA